MARHRICNLRLAVMQDLDKTELLSYTFRKFILDGMMAKLKSCFSLENDLVGSLKCVFF